MLRRTAAPLAGRLLRALEGSSTGAVAAAGTSALTSSHAAAGAAASLSAARASRSFASGPMDVGLPRPPQTPSGMVPDADGMLPTTAALKNPSADIFYDSHSHEQFAPGGDQTKRAFTYFVLTGGRFVYASAIRLAVLKLVLSMTATKDVLAMASLEVDLAKVGAGQTVTVKWRGKPVFVRRRTEVEIAEAREVPMSALRDPQPDDVRVINPEWLVVVGVCTHLGCVPLPGAGDYNGWFCPCHGSHYDTSGRIRKGPAPTNLEVPEYKFIKDDGTLLIG